MDEWSGRISTTTKKRKKNERRQRNELKRAREKAKKEYLDCQCDEIIEFQRTGRYDLMYMKTKELDWKDNQGIQIISI
jgi:hypothetical protein